jgi:hypothetical protein
MRLVAVGLKDYAMLGDGSMPAGLRSVERLVSGTKLPFAAVQNYVRFLGYSGREMLAVRLSHFDPDRT